ncbi:MAG: EamA family transporter [Acidobacteria bacterium]|nr:EamA family transporter [Acidobacteriota bacterium]
MAKPLKNPVYYVLFAVLLWSTGGMFIKLATNLDAYQVTFFRSLLAAITVLVITRKNGLRINAFGIMCSVIYAVLLFLFVWATKHTTAANAIFLQYTAPVYILILAPFVIGEKFHLRDLATVIFCIAGMSLFFVGDLSIGDYQGNIAALGSGIFLGLYIMLLKHPKAVGTQAASLPDSGSPPYQGGVAAASADGVVLSSESETAASTAASAAASPLNPVITVIYGNLILAVLTLPSGIASAATITWLDFAAVAFLGIFQIGISYILFIKGVRGGTRPLDASIIGFIEPLLNPVWVFLFVGERPSQWALLGGTIIIATVVAHTFVQYRRPAARS